MQKIWFRTNLIKQGFAHTDHDMNMHFFRSKLESSMNHGSFQLVCIYCIVIEIKKNYNYIITSIQLKDKTHRLAVNWCKVEYGLQIIRSVLESRVVIFIKPNSKETLGRLKMLE